MKRVHNTTPSLRSLFHQRALVGARVDVPVVIVIEVPVIWEVLPRWGLVAVVAGMAGLVGLVGLGLVFQNLRDEAMVGLGGDEDVWQHKGLCCSVGRLFPLVFLDSS